MASDACKTCRFWRAFIGYKDGRCRRFPPQPLMGMGSSNIDTSFQPKTDQYDWCGEYSAKETSGEQ